MKKNTLELKSTFVKSKLFPVKLNGATTKEWINCLNYR